MKWIFFDLRWTLVDETKAHRSRLQETCACLQRIGIRPSVEELFRMCEDASTDFAPSPFLGMLARLGLSGEQVDRIMQSVRYAKENENLYPGVSQILDALSERYSLAVIANQSEGTEKRLRKWNIRQYFEFVLASAELGLAKPDPKIFECALSKSGCQAEHALMVGDRLDNDIGPAKLQGLTTVRVLKGLSRFQVPRFPHEIPDWTISGVGEILGLTL